MKRILKMFIISFMAITLLAGCGGKKSSVSRVEGKSFTFTAEEFKNYFNDEVGMMGTKLKEFSGSKMEKADGYMYFGELGDCSIYAFSDTENGKLTDVSINFYGGTETNKGNMLEIKLSSSEVKTVEKYASIIFDICEPNVKTMKFNDFFNKTLKYGGMFKDRSEEIGDLNVSFDTKPKLGFSFEPKKQQ